MVAGAARKIGPRVTTSIDTNVIVAFWDADDALHRTARRALEAAFERGSLVTSGVVYAELLAVPGRTEAFLDEFYAHTGIMTEWELAETVWREAGAAFQRYAARRRKQKGTQPRRILTDFVIGAHALVNDYKLLTLDAGIYQASFPRLSIAEV
jgi:predicted nucleic acid-binding protein